MLVTTAAVMAMVAMALPGFAAAQDFGECKSHSRESKCFRDTAGDPTRSNFGDFQSAVASNAGGQAAQESHNWNPSQKKTSALFQFAG